jgi:drug/metabolite transporter (DMT)-like permease
VVERLFHRWVLKDRPSIHGYAILYQCMGAVVLATYLMIHKDEQPTMEAIVANGWWILAAGIAWMCFAFFSFSADRLLPISYKAIISRLRIIWIWLLGIFAFAEVITFNKILGGILLVSGVIVLSRTKEKINARGAMLEGVGSLFVSLALTLDKVLTQTLSPTFVAMLAFLNAGVLFMLIFPRSLRDAGKIFRELGFKILLPVLAGTMSYLCFVACLKQGELSVVVPLYQTSSIITLVVGHFVFRELGNLSFKLSCGVLSAVGAILMVMR